MTSFEFNQKSAFKITLDQDFAPMVLNNRAYRAAVAASGQAVPVKIALIRSNNQIATIETAVFAAAMNQFDANIRYIERLVKTLLWLKGGYKVIFGGPKDIGLALQKIYQKDEKRAFDAAFMSRIYEQPFTVVVTDIDSVPDQNETSHPMGRHLDGCRIGFDAGGSDRKVSAVIDGESVYSEEVVWHPKLKDDPSYHYHGILDSIKRAATHLPRVDAIGVSAAGIYIDNRVAAASLFIRVPQDKFDAEVRDMFLNIAKEMGDVPIEVANDGDVTALAGAMSLDADKVLGIAMGTSQAAGYVDADGNITGWLNELAFVPVDYNSNAMVDEWSLDVGCGVKYFSQDGVIKLATAAGIDLDDTLSPAEKLKVVQELMEEGDRWAAEVFDTIGVYLGYSLAHYAEFYDIAKVLVLGRVTSGKGGQRLVAMANKVLQQEFPSLYNTIELILPDEQSRRVGQSIAAASLPQIRKEESR